MQSRIASPYIQLCDIGDMKSYHSADFLKLLSIFLFVFPSSLWKSPHKLICHCSLTCSSSSRFVFYLDSY